MANEFDYSVLEAIVSEQGAKRSSVIAILQGIQEHYRYIPPQSFEYLAEKLDMSAAQVYSVATFYENFSLEAKGKYVVKICDGTACHVRGSIPILTALRKHLGLSEAKKTTDDMLFTLETVSCLGACGLAPAMTVNDEVHPSMTPDKAVELIESLRKESENA